MADKPRDITTLEVEAREIFERALEEHNPAHKFALFSGGDDSLATTFLIMEQLGADAVVHIDTGIGIPETRQYVRDVCKQFGWELLVYHAHDHTDKDGNPTPQIYEELVLRWGFPGPAHHGKMFARLKGRQVARLVREHKEERHDRILLATGLRTSESRRRMLLKGREIDRNGAKLWVNPAFYWSGEEVKAYREHYNLPRNPVAEKICMSGECLCGAFAKPGEFAEVAACYPEVGERLRALEEKVRAQGFPWDWDEEPPDWYLDAKGGQAFLPGTEPDDFDEAILCSGCKTGHADRESVDISKALEELQVSVGKRKGHKVEGSESGK